MRSSPDAAISTALYSHAWKRAPDQPFPVRCGMQSRVNFERFHTVVIGGGQAGLAVGYFLAKRGIPFVILDAHPRIGDAWRRRWDSLRLFTPAGFSGLPGLPFPRGMAFPTKDAMADYLEAYAQRFQLPVRTG